MSDNNEEQGTYIRGICKFCGQVHMVGISTVIKSGKIYRLKATKRKMYKLAKKYFDVDAKLKDVELSMPRHGYGFFLDYALEGVKHHYTLLPAGGGNASLMHATTRYGDNGEVVPDWHACRVSFKTLKRLKMIERVYE